MVDLPYSSKRTLIFDLDETLIHSFDNQDEVGCNEVVFIKLDPDEDPVPVGINIRPFARECLQEAAKFFQVILFTASEKDYADPIIDLIDPDRKLISARFYRSSCFYYNGSWVKDLRIFKKPLSDIAIIDNSIPAFRF